MSSSQTGRFFVDGPFTVASAMTDGAPGNPARAILLSCSVDAWVILTLPNGNTVNVFPQAGSAGTGDNIYPFSVLQYHVSTGTIVSAYSLG